MPEFHSDMSDERERTGWRGQESKGSQQVLVCLGMVGTNRNEGNGKELTTNWKGLIVWRNSADVSSDRSGPTSDGQFYIGPWFSDHDVPFARLPTTSHFRRRRRRSSRFLTVLVNT